MNENNFFKTEMRIDREREEYVVGAAQNRVRDTRRPKLS